MTFEEILGNNVAKKSLTEQIKNNGIVHSYMFVGQDGIGKKIIAKEFARKVLCKSINESLDEYNNSKNCESCIKFESNNHPDFKIISPEGNYIKIAQIRQMQEDVYKKPILSKKKIFIIDKADYMTEEAQNSLLKTLEEPPEYIVIILILSNESLLLNTIKSRCMKINFLNIPEDEIKNYINRNNLIENPSKNMLKLFNGSIGKIYEIKENMDIYIQTEQLTKEILQRKIISVIELLKKSEFIYKSKEYANNILEYMTVIVYSDITEKIESGEIVNKTLLKIIEIIKNTIIKLKSNANYDMIIDEMIFNIYEVTKH